VVCLFFALLIGFFGVFFVEVEELGVGIKREIFKVCLFLLKMLS
jgi:hypothetical protein